MNLESMVPRWTPADERLLIRRLDRLGWRGRLRDEMGTLTIPVRSVLTGIRIDPATGSIVFEGVLVDEESGATVRHYAEQFAEPAGRAALAASDLVRVAEAWIAAKLEGVA